MSAIPPTATHMESYRYVLQRYAGQQTRHKCPQCGKPKKFTRYIDQTTGEYLNERVGRCDRQDTCGYHYKPKEFFNDRSGLSQGDNVRNSYNLRRHLANPVDQHMFVHSRDEVKHFRRFSDQNNLSEYYRPIIGEKLWDGVMKRYAMGTIPDGPLRGASIFWQVDRDGRIRAGKIMQYDPETGKRVKNGKSFSWMHIFNKEGSASEIGLQQCLFGEHQLKDSPIDQIIAVVESEKTALLATASIPEYCWMAVGSSGQFKMNSLTPLTGRKVMAFPDLSQDGIVFRKWKDVAQQCGALFNSIGVSDILERRATDDQRTAGLDIADYFFINHCGGVGGGGTSDTLPPQLQPEAQGFLDTVGKANPGVMALIAACDLDLEKAVITPLDTAVQRTSLEAL